MNKIPEQLKVLRQWLCWRRVPKPLADGSIRIGKVPINPVKGILLAQWQQERHWLTFMQASKYLVANKCDGVGFVFNGAESFSGIDLDKCLIDGVLLPWAQEIVDRCGSYTERSPSGMGLRIFVGGKPIGVTTKVKKALGGGAAIELFAGAGCFLTVTGDATSETMRDNGQDAIDWLMTMHFQKDKGGMFGAARAEYPPISLSDQGVVNKARQAKNGALFTALFDHGDASRYGDDKSAADFALCSMLIYWCDGDVDRADQLFRCSALMRSKWDERHGSGTYGQLTMQRAATKMR